MSFCLGCPRMGDSTAGPSTCCKDPPAAYVIRAVRDELIASGRLQVAARLPRRRNRYQADKDTYRP